MEGLEKHVLADPNRWAETLGWFRLGYGLRRVAREINVTPAALRRWIELNPDRAAEVADAEGEFVEGIEGMLNKAALDGEPWAISKILGARHERYQEKPAQTQVVITSAEDLSRLIALVRQRPLPSGGSDEPDDGAVAAE